MRQSLCSFQHINLVHLVRVRRKIRDPRKQGDAKSLPPSEKVYALAVQGPRIVVGAADRSVLIYDSRYVLWWLLWMDEPMFMAHSFALPFWIGPSSLHAHSQEPDRSFGSERVRA